MRSLFEAQFLVPDILLLMSGPGHRADLIQCRVFSRYRGKVDMTRMS
jgi:hypothetical protein